MKNLEIDFFELEDAMTWNNELSEDHRYINIKTGEVYAISVDVLATIEDGNEEGLLDWQEDDLEIAKEFLDNEDQFIIIPKIESRESYRWMQEFIESLDNTTLAEKLADAIDRSKPFRRFKDTLIEYDKENEAWFKFYSSKIKEEAAFWLNSKDIVPNWSEGK